MRESASSWNEVLGSEKNEREAVTERESRDPLVGSELTVWWKKQGQRIPE